MADKNGSDGLNDAQKQAVLHKEGPLLVMAGAGSGKTKVLTHRVAHLITCGVPPEKILAVTFTNKAAGEMRERIAKLIQDSRFEIPSSMPWIGTFHSLGAWILRREAHKVGLKKNFSILDEEDSLSFFKETIKELALDPKQFQPSRIRKIISAKKCDLIEPKDLGNETSDYFSKRLSLIWSEYEKKLKSSNGLDFDDLLVRTAFLFSTHPETLGAYQRHWQYVLIDEYQDTDFVQDRVANMLAAHHSNICVVGDIDQSIYSFRGADFKNILNFEASYPQAKIITLEENYRSQEPILKAANAVIAKNEFRKPKNLFTRKKDNDGKLALCAADTEKDEADFIVSKTEEIIAGGVRPDEIAVLFRTNAQSRVLEEKFLERGVLHRVVGVKFYNRMEVKDILAYIKASLNPDDLLSKKRIINRPTRGLGKATLAKYVVRSKLTPRENEKISLFEKMLEKIKMSSQKLAASKAVASAIKESGYADMFDQSTEEGITRLANIKELVSLATKFDRINPPDGILKMLEEAALMSEQDALDHKKAGVSLTTVHAAKGLEFDYVFISGLEDGLFPHTSFGGENGKIRLEEERRLFYVALTRARKKVFLSMAFLRMVFGERQANMPSRFLSDIPPELLEQAEKEEKIIEI